MHWMIFGNRAINMALIEQMTHGGDSVILTTREGVHITVGGVTIDDILTAIAAGQSRINATSVHASNGTEKINTVEGEPMQPLGHFDDGSRKGRTRGNDPQAMRAIGRR